MKTLHIHLKSNDLEKSVAFYAAMFGAPPTRLEPDYAKWLLDDPKAHISVSTHGGAPGVDHVGVAIENETALAEVADRLRAGGEDLFEEKATTCCYARSNKFWAKDPSGAIWELFQTFGDSKSYGEEPERELAARDDDAGSMATPSGAGCCPTVAPSA